MNRRGYLDPHLMDGQWFFMFEGNLSRGYITEGECQEAFNYAGCVWDKEPNSTGRSAF